MTLRTITGISAVALSAATLAAALAISPGQTTQAQAPVGPPFKSVPTFSTDKIGRQGHFYVGGKWEGEPGVERMRGSMYVETWVPKEIRYPYPIVFVGEGGGQSSVQMLMTPDGRPGWAYDFVNRGYTVYMMDFPGRGRSPFIPGVDGTLAPPRSGPLMEEIWVHSRTPKAGLTQPGPDGHGPTWPQFSKYSAWPSTHPNKGRMGDPVFDYFAKMEQQSLAGPGAELTVPALTELLDLIGQPTIMILHSGVASYGWAVADRRPKLVKAIIAAEPVAPPIETTERRSPGTYTPGRLWGLSGVPMTYDPPAKEASELKTVKQEKADAPDLIESGLMSGDREAFVATYGPLFEHSPWVAEDAWSDRPFADADELFEALRAAMYAAPREKQLALIRAHPDLAGKAAIEGTLTHSSTREQASAGLDRLTPDEFEAFTRTNTAYRERFGFPFVICVREHTKESILRVAAERLEHTRDEEVRVALEEVAKIARLRMKDVL